MQHRGERTVLVADDADRARRRRGVRGRGDEHRDSRVHEHLQGLRAEHHAERAPPPVRGHEDQVAAGVARRRDDRQVRRVADRAPRLAGHAHRARRGLRLREQLARPAFERVGEVGGRRQPHHLGVAEQRRRVVRLGMEERDARADAAGEFDGAPDRLDREIGPVDGHEQVTIHVTPRKAFADRRAGRQPTALLASGGPASRQAAADSFGD